MIPKLNPKYIESAKITAFRSSSVDSIIKQYEHMGNKIYRNVIEDRTEKLNKLTKLYNNHLMILGDNVSEWTAGRSNHKKNNIDSITKSTNDILSYIQKIDKEVKEIKGNSSKESNTRIKLRLLNDIGYYQSINKKLFYESLVKLYYLDKNTFKLTYKQLANKISAKSNPAKLYKDLKEME